MEEHVIEAFDDAQRRANAMLADLLGRLEPGMSELDIARLARSRLPDFGFDGWYHPPEVQIGPRTARAPTWRLPSRRARLHPGDPLVISIGPWGGRAFGDAGTTIRFQAPPSPLMEVARACTRATCGYASRWKCIGELFVFARSWALNNRYELANRRSIGHAILPAEGWRSQAFPRSAHAVTWLRRHQIHFLNPRRMHGMYAVRPQLTDRRTGACFQEMVLVDGDLHRVLGRDSPSEAGSEHSS